MPDSNKELVIPPTEVVRERLASVTGEARLLRKLLRVAKSRDQAYPNDQAKASPDQSEAAR